MTPEQENQNYYLGYFASILLALILASWVAGMVQPLLPPSLSAASLETITAALFFGLCAANPVGLFFRAQRAGAPLIRFGLGVVFGVVVHAGWVLPAIGLSMNRLVMILIAALGVPLMVLADQLRARLAAPGTAGDHPAWARPVLHVLRWPDRFLFISIMALSFAFFVGLADTMQKSLIGLGLCILWMAVASALRAAHDMTEAARQRGPAGPWDHLLPTEAPPAPPSPMEELRAEARKVMLSLLPGAAFFGALMWLAASVIPVIHPMLAAELGAQDGLAGLKATGLVALTGLAIVFFGALISVGLGFAVMHVLGHYARWPRERVRLACRRLMKSMSLRPMRRL